ncbi:MAG: M28 family peptidase [Methylobacter sp.]|nr:M28 family peptidase [Methylobacter sp.]
MGIQLRKLQLPVSRSWSFASRVPNLEIGNQHNDVILIGAHYDSVFASPGANDLAPTCGALPPSSL